tara:strand:+ start:2158 stop:2376 length:219 start_codon:yes stop_codon:yes gene_type:complete
LVLQGAVLGQLLEVGVELWGLMESTFAILLVSQLFVLRELLLKNLRQNADHLSTSACCAAQGIQEPYQESGN